MPTEHLPRKILQNHWLDAISAQGMGVVAALLLLLLGWYADQALVAVLPTSFLAPCRILLTLLLCFADLMIRSPILAGQATFYLTLINVRDARAMDVFAAYRGEMYKKAVVLRAALWGRRVMWSAVAFLPTALLLACGDRLRARGLTTAKEQLGYLLLAMSAVICLIVGALAVELLLLRYMPAWYLLPECRTVREAMRFSRCVMRGQIGNAAFLYGRYAGWLLSCLLVVPYAYAAPLFGAARAEWVEERRQESILSDVYFAVRRKNC